MCDERPFGAKRLIHYLYISLRTTAPIAALQEVGNIPRLVICLCEIVFCNLNPISSTRSCPHQHLLLRLHRRPCLGLARAEGLLPHLPLQLEHQARATSQRDHPSLLRKTEYVSPMMGVVWALLYAQHDWRPRAKFTVGSFVVRYIEGFTPQKSCHK